MPDTLSQRACATGMLEHPRSPHRRPTASLSVRTAAQAQRPRPWCAADAARSSARTQPSSLHTLGAPPPDGRAGQPVERQPRRDTDGAGLVPDGAAPRRLRAGRRHGGPRLGPTDDRANLPTPASRRRCRLGGAGSGQGILGRGQICAVPVSTSAALATVSVAGSTSEIAVVATGSRAPGARVATETCGIHDAGR